MYPDRDSHAPRIRSSAERPVTSAAIRFRRSQRMRRNLLPDAGRRAHHQVLVPVPIDSCYGFRVKVHGGTLQLLILPRLYGDADPLVTSPRVMGGVRVRQAY
jgi:hypothetical protein